MKRSRSRVGGGVAVGLLAVLALAACGGGGDGGTAAIARPSTTVTTARSAEGTPTPTTAAVVTTQPAGRGGGTTAPTTPRVSTPPASTVKPVDQPDRPGMAHLTINPGVAAVGTRVRLQGDGFTGEMYQVPQPSLWLNGAGPAGCNLYAQAIHDVTLSADGRISGEFIVPVTGECRQGDTGVVAVQPGRYDIVFGCTVCTLGSVEVVAQQLPPPPSGSVECDDVVFDANGENAAYNIVATGISCAEAEAFVARIGGPLGPVNGAARVEAEGFTCARISESIVGLPTASYECGRGETRINFDRS